MYSQKVAQVLRLLSRRRMLNNFYYLKDMTITTEQEICLSKGFWVLRRCVTVSRG